jgi:hypothetical protein
MSGRVITFYSWKGGVGRTMALANIGIQLARLGKRVLAVDWDLEAPGLDRYFRRMKKAVKWPVDQTGLLGVLNDGAANSSQPLLPEVWRHRCAEIQVAHLQQNLPRAEFQSQPTPIHFLGTGMSAAGYAARLQSFSWNSFFAEHNGASRLEDLRTQWREMYDFVLIDSRTGLTDGGGVCTVQMPDVLVFVLTANHQSLMDGLAFLKGVQEARAVFEFERAPLMFVPLLTRWEEDPKTKLAETWLELLAAGLGKIVETWLPRDLPVRRMLERLRVSHGARLSFGEPLPVVTGGFAEQDPSPAYNLIAEILASGFSNAGAIIDPSYGASVGRERT